MRMVIKIVLKNIKIRVNYFLFIILIFISCGKKKCNISLIDNTIIDTTKIEKSLVFHNESKSLDSLILSDYYNHNKKHKVKSLMSYIECGHSIGMSYEFRKESINLNLEKKSETEFMFSVNGFCFRKNIYMSIDEAKSDSLYVINMKDICHNNTELKEIGFKKFRPVYFITKNEEIWKAVQFLR